ncbi:BON domain-containing protein [Rhodocyclus gracilis]|uniref:BON domain-containing protein n=1 Tax=Rhodocyclus gracilis TaxID=2929842 RepID=UPI001E6060E5|nr:BON domain-containing protein [Rhodocyclus gracilis]
MTTMTIRINRHPTPRYGYRRVIASVFLGGMLLYSSGGFAADDKPSATREYVKDSVITTKIKSQLAAEKLSSLIHITVDTDKQGVVVLGGTATSQAGVDRAIAIAHGVSGVTAVENTIRVIGDKY